MAEKKRAGRVRWIALGTILGVVAVWGGFGIVGAATSAPTAITTCTKASNGKTKIIPAGSVSTCTAKGKGFAKSWTDASAARYHNFMRGTGGGSCAEGGGGTDFRNLDLSGLFIFGCYEGANLSGANMSNAILTQSSFDNVNLAHVNLTNAFLFQDFFSTVNTTGVNTSGTIWQDVTCPDSTNSDTNGTSPASCNGHGF